MFDTIKAAGPKGSLFASSFPVGRLYGRHAGLRQSSSGIVCDMTDTKMAVLLGGSAERIYRI
jgi:predicted TIM-barrel fold metal-dependent hydrolase